jgi:hypothetical protein
MFSSQENEAFIEGYVLIFFPGLYGGLVGWVVWAESPIQI